MKLGPVLKYPGSKWSLADWIIQHMPRHTTYLEPYFGSGAVFFNKPRSKVETINDIDGQVVNLFKVIREWPEELARQIQLTPWARDEYYLSYEITGNPIEDARRFLVRSWQAFGFRPVTRTGWRSNIKDLNGNIGNWHTKLPVDIMHTAKRLQGVQIENQPAIQLIKRYNQPDVLIYADPPYPLSTREKKIYKYEMSDDDHVELLATLNEHVGPVIISSYECDLYNDLLLNWHKKTRRALAEGGRERQEVIWLNQEAQQRLGQVNLFSLD